MSVHVSALHLPQFHRTPENDLWWGKGFTEWTNVTKAKPLYPGHKQPNLPTDLGLYDLRVEASRIEQAALAQESGIDSFCYWHYWFAGRRVLTEPVALSLESSKETFPFFLNWANETWQGRWYGASGTTLIEQTYPGEQDYINHFEAVLPYFKSERYVKFDGKPVFAIYKPKQIPNLSEFKETWDHLAREAGFNGIYWVGQVDSKNDVLDIKSSFDRLYLNPGALWKILFGMDYRIFERLRLPRLIDASRFPRDLQEFHDSFPEVAPCVMPHWDNTPRSNRRGNVWVRNSTTVFEQQLKVAFETASQVAAPHAPGLIMVKSWNEWAESNCLEPGGWWGHGFLETLRKLRSNYDQ